MDLRAPWTDFDNFLCILKLYSSSFEKYFFGGVIVASTFSKIPARISNLPDNPVKNIFYDILLLRPSDLNVHDAISTFMTYINHKWFSHGHEMIWYSRWALDLPDNPVKTKFSRYWLLRPSDLNVHDTLSTFMTYINHKMIF